MLSIASRTIENETERPWIASSWDRTESEQEKNKIGRGAAFSATSTLFRTVSRVAALMTRSRRS